MITAQDMQSLARYLVEHHGSDALHYADLAVDELETQGEQRRANAWRALRSLVTDIIDGRTRADAVVVLH